MNEIKSTNRKVVDTALLDIWAHHKEKGRYLRTRPLVTLVVERSTTEDLVIYCAIGQVAQHKLCEFLEQSENISEQKEDIINIMDIEKIGTIRFTNEALYKLYRGMDKGRVEKFWQKVNVNLRKVLEEVHYISIDTFLKIIIQAKKEFEKDEKYKSNGK